MHLIRARLRQTPIRWLILGYYIGILVVTLGLLSLGLSAVFGRYLWRSNEARLRASVQSAWFREAEDEPATHQPLRQGLPAPPDFPQNADDLARRIATAGVLVRILDPDGHELAMGGRFRHAPQIDLTQVNELKALAGKRQRQRIAYLAGERQEWQVLLMPIVDKSGGLVGILQVSGFYRPVRELLAALSGYLLLGGALAGVMALGVTFVVARFLSHPLEQLISATRRVRAGDLSARTGLQEGRNEIYAVASAFDAMVTQLQENFESQRRFVADASHELKTPLTAIGGMAEVLRVGADGGKPEQRELALRTIEKEVDRMSGLVTDLLTLSRAEQTRAAAPERVDLAPLAEELVGEYKVLAPGHHFTMKLADSLSVRGDGEQLRRVLRNLLENAVKYSAPGSTVALEGRVHDREVVLEVRDEGVGIAAGDLAQVFERFFRADQSRARKTGGSGLGLSIVRALVEQHGGRVRAASVVGKGTTMTVVLPKGEA